MNSEVNKGSNFSTKTINNSSINQIIVGRVIDIILDDKHPQFKNLGEWDSLGNIFFVEADKVISNDINLENLATAKPLVPNQKYYPLKNELVYILSFPTGDSQSNYSITEYYYVNVINIWNHPHHNALPKVNNTDSKLPNDYSNIATGNTQLQKDSSTKLNLGNTFKERNDINSLQPFEGDYILEGRWGHSIRFGSTVKSSKSEWSINGKDGSPILIIKNGQKVNTNEGWIPQLEEVNGDDSLAYFTSDQSIPIEVASTNLKTFNLTLSKLSEDQKSNIKTPSTNITTAGEIKPSSTKVSSTNISGSTNFTTLDQSQIVDDFNIDPSLFNEDKESVDSNAISDTYTSQTSNLQSDSNPYQGSKKIYYNVSYQSQNDSNDPNVRKYGCAATAAAMVISFVSKQSVSKEKIIQLSGGLTINFPQVASQYGLKYKEVHNYSELSKTLETQPVVLLINSLSSPGNPTKQHFVAAIGINGDGNIIIHDPVRAFGPNTILSKTRYHFASLKNKIRIFY